MRDAQGALNYPLANLDIRKTPSTIIVVNGGCSFESLLLYMVIRIILYHQLNNCHD